MLHTNFTHVRCNKGYFLTPNSKSIFSSTKGPIFIMFTAFDAQNRLVSNGPAQISHISYFRIFVIKILIIPIIAENILMM